MSRTNEDSDIRWYKIQRKRSFTNKKDKSLQKFFKDNKKSRYLERRKMILRKIEENHEYTTEDITLESLEDWVIIKNNKTDIKEIEIDTKETKSLLHRIISWFV